MRSRSSPAARLETLLAEIRACRLCAETLPLGPRPVLRASTTARVALCSQAPGTKVHASGLPFTDRSGDRLREWLAVDSDTFYDERRIAIVPMGFCYPGVDAKGGDLPPRPECRTAWHGRLFQALPQIELMVVIGGHAMAYHLGKRRKPSVRETVTAFREYLPRIVPLPHPSWRNNAWLERNPWFESELLPVLRASVHRLIT
jgi:uracil-DNA glycosylase